VMSCDRQKLPLLELTKLPLSEPGVKQVPLAV
jgi:hypothetical protein